MGVDETNQELAEILFDPNNLAIVKLLHEGARTVAELAAELSLTEPDVIGQLAELENIRIAKRTETARGPVFELADDKLEAVVDLMNQNVADQTRDDIDEPEEVDVDEIE